MMPKKTFHTQYDKEMLVILSKMINEVFHASPQFRRSSKNHLRKATDTFNRFFNKRYEIGFLNAFHLEKACNLCGVKQHGKLTKDSYIFTSYDVNVDLNTKDLSSMYLASVRGFCDAGKDKMNQVDDFMDRVIRFELENKDLFLKYFGIQVNGEKYEIA